MNVKCYHYI